MKRTRRAQKGGGLRGGCEKKAKGMQGLINASKAQKRLERHKSEIRMPKLTIGRKQRDGAKRGEEEEDSASSNEFCENARVCREGAGQKQTEIYICISSNENISFSAHQHASKVGRKEGSRSVMDEKIRALCSC